MHHFFKPIKSFYNINRTVQLCQALIEDYERTDLFFFILYSSKLEVRPSAPQTFLNLWRKPCGETVDY